MYDAIIVGAGPAGASCALWLARLGFAPLLVEAGSQVGGLCLAHPFADDWNASLPGHTGPQVAANFAVSLQRAQVPVLLSQPVQAVSSQQGGFAVTTRNGKTLQGRHLVLATGTRARGLAHSGAEVDARASANTCASEGAGVNSSVNAEAHSAASRVKPFPGVLIGPGDHIVAQQFEGLKVAVLGGGDNGFENALYATERA